MSGRQRLVVAALLRGREAHEVDALRRVLGSSEIDRIAPHITLIAPMNVADSLVASFGAAVEQAVSSSAPMSIELQGVSTFPPGHHVLYLGVAGEIDRLGVLRDRLGVAAREHHDGRAFVPHVTLKSHADPDLIEHAVALMARYTLPLVIDRITLLRLDESSPRRVWEPCDEFVLGSMLTIGRGGREIVLSRATMLSAQDREFRVANSDPDADVIALADVSRQDGDSNASDRRARVVMRARIDGRLVGLIVGDLHGEFFVFEEIVVDRDRRREGIGRQLMRYLDRNATELGIRELVVVASDDAVMFFDELGFRPVADHTAATRSVRMTRVMQA